ncbi:spore coat protein [Gorillibacterium massiliense]|uniref:spore coat protein n=1 Tax=Gorillibacterium massiliense TaxID=1280390 RepID=UPI0004BC56FE|nr:spore coat protein [Gorillibacterium massiliense]
MQYPVRNLNSGFLIDQTTGFSRNIYLLDFKQGDVNGDGIVDNIYLYGNKPDGPSGVFADNITLSIQDGFSKQHTTLNLESNSGYNARLFLGDFNKDHISDIFISIDSGGSGGYGIFYIYSFKNNHARILFDFNQFNQDHKFKVNYEDFYKVSVSSPELDVLFMIDISNKGPDYLTQYYNENGKLKHPVSGEVLALGGLFPIVTNTKSMSYDLLALQRIIGTSNADTLGFVETLLTWNGKKFISSRMTVAIFSTKLIALY